VRARREIPALFAVWAACTAINVGKAAHIDDTAHLEIAAWIAEHPLHPMQGTVDWEHGSEPIHRLNQPHLFFYFLALARALLGPGTIPGQLVVAVFVAIGILSFHRLWRRMVGSRGAILGPALLFLGPAFVPGQNVMTDAPLVATWILFLDLLTAARGRHASRSLALAAVALSVAILIKYTSLVLLPVLALDVHLRGASHRRQLAVLAIPLAALAAWSLFNLADYGGIHVLERPIASAAFSLPEAIGITIGRAAIWVLTLGAIVPFAAPLLRLGSARGLGLAALAIAALTVATRRIVPYVPPMHGETVLHSAARAAFFVAGLAVLALAYRAVRDRARSSGYDDARAIAVLGATIALGALFVIVLSPFVAVRHVLLILPALMIVLARAHLDLLSDPRARPLLALGAALTIALGVLLGTSDRRWADCYRDAAQRHRREASPGVRTVFVGHWGWQWYATEAGFVRYEPDGIELRTGDRVIRPRLVDQPAIPGADAARLVLRQVDRIEPGGLDLLRTTTDRLGYYSVWHGLPWTISDAAVEVFEIHEVVDAAVRQ
jgi:hypothetical protein